MKRQPSSPRAFTLIELLVLTAVMLLVVMLATALASTRAQAARLNCANNLKRIGLAFGAWNVEHGGRYPMRVPNTEGGTANNLVNQILIYSHFAVLSNELNTPKVMVCPSDQRTAHTDFIIGHNWGPLPRGLNNNYVSYFVGRDCDETRPQMFLSGDRNIYGPATTPNANNGYGNSPSGSPGILIALGTNIAADATTPGWTDKMHQQQGNICRADGSIDQLNSHTLRDQLRKTGDTTTPIPNVILFP